MLEAFSRGQRSRTLLLLLVVAVLALAARAVGIDDNPLGISLVMLSGVSLVLAFTHAWRSSAQFRRLIYASISGFVVLFILGVALQVLMEMTDMPGPVEQLVGVVATAFTLAAAFLCIPGLLVGAAGTFLMRRRERRGSRWT